MIEETIAKPNVIVEKRTKHETGLRLFFYRRRIDNQQYDTTKRDHGFTWNTNTNTKTKARGEMIDTNQHGINSQDATMDATTSLS